MSMLNLGPNSIEVMDKNVVNQTCMVIYDEIKAGDIPLYKKREYWTNIPIKYELLNNREIKVNCDPSIISKRDVLYSIQDDIKLELISTEPVFKDINCTKIIIANKPEYIGNNCFVPKKLSLIEKSNNISLNIDEKIYSEYCSRIILEDNGKFSDYTLKYTVKDRDEIPNYDVFPKKQILFQDGEITEALSIYTKHNFSKIKEEIIEKHEKIKHYWNRLIDNETKRIFKI